MRQFVKRNRILFLGLGILLIVAGVAVGVWRYNGPVAASQAYHRAVNTYDWVAVSQMHCQPTPAISSKQPANYHYDINHITYSITSEGFRNAVVHYTGPLTITTDGKQSTITDEGQFIWHAQGLSWCLTTP